jgi:hypothetical protein
MITSSRRPRGFVPLAMSIGLLIVPQAGAHGGRGGHGGGHGGGHAAQAPHFSARQPTYTPPRMPRAATAARGTSSNSGGTHTRGSSSSVHAQGNKTHAQSIANHSQALASSTHAANNATATASSTHAGNNATATTSSIHARNNAAAAASSTHTRNNVTSTSGTGSSAVGTGSPTTLGTMPTLAASNALVPSAYTFGNGRGARSYRAYGYGNGYRNRSYGRGYGYGRSQGLNRGVVAGLMSVHASLARVAHNYQGHRARAMNAVTMAIRQLSHRSMMYSGMGSSSGVNNRGALGMRQGGGAGALQPQGMSQAQSDNRMGQALRRLQGINMQLASQGSYTNGHSRASGHVQQAMRELNFALSIR